MSKPKKQVIVIEANPELTPQGAVINGKKRVAAYCRVSSNNIEQKTSYLAQVDEYGKRITQNPDWEFVNIYADEAKTGTSTKDRAQFNQMIIDCENGKIDLIITKSISRFARNVEDSITTVRQLKTLNVEVYFEKENIYSFDGKSDMIFTILASVAQEESRNISENCSWGLKKRIREGTVIVNHNRFLGYTKDENGELVILEDEAKTVRYIFSRYLQGAGYTTIAKELEVKGYLTGAGNTKWHASGVSIILKNEKYYGNLLQQKTYTTDYLSHSRKKNRGQLEQFSVADNHPAIISKEIWDAVQEKRQAKYLRTCGNNPNKERYSSCYAFSGKLYCEKCGATLKRRTWNAKTKAERIVWQCNDYINQGKRACDSKAVGDITLKNAFIQVYNNIITNKNDFFQTFIATIEKVIEKGKNKGSYKQALKNVTDVERKISKLVQMKLEGEISIDDFKREYDALCGYRDKLAIIKNQYIENELSADDKKRKVLAVRELLHTNNLPLTEFDDSLFKALVEKILIADPVTFTFVLINGVTIPINAKDLRDGRRYNQRMF